MKDTASGAQVTLRDFEAQGQFIKSLEQSFLEQKNTHAYLISGIKGVGKKTLARLLGQVMFCIADTGRPCGQCPPCRRYIDGNHPDALTVESDTTIKVDQIRDLLDDVAKRPYEGGKRAIFFPDAARLQPQAQNCLLKTLEEPSPDNVFFLIAEDTSSLLPTIISRCRNIRLHPWPDEYIRQTLKEKGIPDHRISQTIHAAGGSIGQALAIATDDEYWTRRQFVQQKIFEAGDPTRILAVSAQLKDDKAHGDELLNDIESMVHEMILVNQKRLPLDAMEGLSPVWRDMAENAPVDSLYRLLAAVFAARKEKASQVTWQAVVEALLIHMMEEKKAWQQ